MELALIALVYALTFEHGNMHVRGGAHSSWAAPLLDGERQRSLAGWWRVFVSHPLFLILVLRTLVRLARGRAWCGESARMNLRLIPAHADLVGGLRFVTTSVYAFLPLAFIYRRVHGVACRRGHTSSKACRHPISNIDHRNADCSRRAAGRTAAALSEAAVALKVKGLFDYGVLATRVGRRFEARWLPKGSEMTEAVLEAPDFSATTDLFSIVANVRESRLFLVDLKVVVPLVVMVMLPFVPLLFALLPLDDILTFIQRAVL